MKKGNPAALLPIGIFLVLYLGLGLLFEYGMKIPMGFYNVPIVAAFLVSICIACLQNRGLSFEEKLTVMANGVGNKNIIAMLLIFLEAGVFVGVIGQSAAQNVAYFMLSIIPPQFAVAALFVTSCFTSLSMGTSVGTITLLTPIAVSVVNVSAYSPALCVATIVGGAMFGDNLSPISDTTIASCNGQGCQMKDKFRGNIPIVLPAALITMVIILMTTTGVETVQIAYEYDFVQILPYLLVFSCGAAGINAFAVLFIGIVSGALIAMVTGTIVPDAGQTVFTQLLVNVGDSMAAMFETCIVAVLVAALCGMIREAGGFDSLLYFIRKLFRGKRGGQLGVGLMVTAMDLATANNTIAIVMSNQIAKDLSRDYGITPRRTACLLDIFSCITQGAIPYGAQILVAISAAAKMGCVISVVELASVMYYPVVLLLCVLVSIFCDVKRSKG